MQFDRQSLEEEGFVGWLSFPEARASEAVPLTGGVYVVSYSHRAPVAFLASNPGGRFKGEDPSVTAAALTANWVDADIVYIGKADQLRRRIREFADFGAGKATAPHWGGRLIWQLVASERLRIAWRVTPGEVPLDVEKAMLDEFRRQHGQPPFANNPHRLGR